MNTNKLLVAALLCLIFSGCSSLWGFYIQNGSEEHILVTIIYKVPANEFMEKASQMNYVPRICTPKQYRKDNQKVSLKIMHRSDSTITVSIPSQSTAKIESDNNHTFMNDIRQISYGKNHVSTKDVIATSKKRRFNYIYRID